MVLDELRCSVTRSARRKTMQITVDRDGALLVSAPPGVADEKLRAFVHAKRFWIYTKLAEKGQLRRFALPKEFVDGEGFLFLGRSYRLKLVDKQEEPLRLSGGRFLLRRDAVSAGRDHFVRWYSERAAKWLSDRVIEHQPRMEVLSAGVRVRDLGYRWGSCGKRDWLYFHWKTILLRPRIADYVVVHELAHLRVPSHHSDFWKCVERELPDYATRKQWLAENGALVDAY